MNAPDTFKLAFVGDVMLGRYVNKALRQVPPVAVWGDTLPIFAAADVRICNLECALADGGTRWTRTPKVFHFRSDAKNVAVLQAAHIDCVSNANNHALDYDYAALREMLAVLDSAGVAHAGAGTGLAAWQPAMIIRCGVRIGFFAFTDNEPGWAARADRPGVCYVPADLDHGRAQALLAHVAAVRPHVDWLIVSAHWGSNWGYTPPASQRRLAHALIDHGADVIFGHSCHVCRGIEIYQRRPILYGCGDFIDDYQIDPVERNDQSFIFIVETAGAAVHRLRLYPTLIESCRALRAHGDHARLIARKMQVLCQRLGTDAIWQIADACLTIEVK